MHIIKHILKPSVMVQVCNPSTREAKAGGLQVQGQPGLYSETLSQKLNNNNKIKQNIYSFHFNEMN
jgi:hypothetical protein